jgi:hypothetical protein
MRLDNADTYLRTPDTGPDPLAIMLCETETLAAETSESLLNRGFGHIIAAGPGFKALAEDAEEISAFPAPIHTPSDRTRLLNLLIAAHPGRWILICFSGDFLFYPFAESRSVGDLIEFLGAERRSCVMSYSIDLYSDQMIADGTFSLDNAWFDAKGWYGFERGEGLADIYGGLGWRYEEYVPVSVSRINRPALFQARAGIRIRDDLWFEDDALNTVACPWHNNPTIALMTTRRARMLLEHPNFRPAVKSFSWPGSEQFQWRSEQLVQHGLIEAGQWM